MCATKRRLIAKAPPGWGEAAMHRLKEQYPDEPEKAFATAWSLHGKGVSGKDYMKDAGRKGYEEMHMLDRIVANVCEPIIAKSRKKEWEKAAGNRSAVVSTEVDIHVWAKPADEAMSALYTISVASMPISVDATLDRTIDALRDYLDDMA